MVRQKAAASGISMAEYIRRLIDRDLERIETQADISDIFGLGRSANRTDIAVEGKRAIADAIEADWREKTR